MSIDYDLDELGRVDVVRHLDNNEMVLQEFDYDLDDTGRILAVMELSGRKTIWTYDDSKRLIREEVSGNLIGSYWIEYEYNAVGSRIREVHSEKGERIFSYDSNDRLTTITAASGITQYTFDDNGNLKNEVDSSASQSFNWNDQNELIEQVINDAGSTIALKFSYDAAGHRIQIDRNGTVSRFVVDPGFENPQVIAELDATNAVLSWYGFGQTRVVQVEGQETLFFGEDLHSGTRALYDTSGAIKSTLLYDAYGNPMSSSNETDFGYRNEQRDADSKLVFLRARYYDPSTGTFISRDPFAGFQDSPLSLNEYIYGNSDPINGTDPTGEGALAEQMVAFAIRNSLSILLATGFILHKTNAAYQAGELSATKFLEIVAVEGIITVATGGLGGLIGKGFVYAKTVVTLGPAQRVAFSKLAEQTAGFGRALQVGMNSPRVLAAAQAAAFYVQKGGVQTLTQGLPGVIIPGVGRGGVRSIYLFNTGFGSTVRKELTEEAASKGLKYFVTPLAATSRIAANVPQFTAFIGRILYAFYNERGENNGAGALPRLDVP